MTNSKNKRDEENLRRVQDDCVEGDTVSEGDTSDEEDFDASRINNAKRSSVSIENTKCLEVPSGSADGSVSQNRNRRKLFHFLLAVASLVAISAAVGVGIIVSRKSTVVSTASTTLETETTESFESSSTPVDSGSIADINPTEEDEKVSIPDSDPPSISKDDTLGMLEELVGSNEKVESDKELDGSEDATLSNENKDEKESRPTQWPELVGMTGDEAKDQLELLCGEETYVIYILHENSPTTRDYRFDRIRIFTNDEGIVTTVPHIG